MKLTKSAIATIVLLPFGSSLALADNCTGTDVNVTRKFETTDLGQGHTISIWKAYSQGVSADSNVDAMTGECSGVILATPDGKTQSMGYCARRDKDGDTYSNSWHKGPGADEGTWKRIAGTGKFAGTQASGWWKGAWADGAMSASKWGGTCQ
jgi:hypothetical protein